MNKEHEDMNLSLDELDSVSGGTELSLEDLKEAAGLVKDTYTVKAGDSLHSIAEKFGISTEILFVMNMPVIIKAANEHGQTFLNPVKYADTLFPGTVLQLPVKDSRSNSSLC